MSVEPNAYGRDLTVGMSMNTSASVIARTSRECETRAIEPHLAGGSECVYIFGPVPGNAALAKRDISDDFEHRAGCVTTESGLAAGPRNSDDYHDARIDHRSKPQKRRVVFVRVGMVGVIVNLGCAGL